MTKQNNSNKPKYIYILRHNDQIVGYKTSWSSALRFLDNKLKPYVISLNMKSDPVRLRWEQNTKLPFHMFGYKLESMGLNNLYQYWSVADTISIEKVHYADHLVF